MSEKTNNVIALGRIAGTTEPVEVIINELKRLLACAEAGEIRGFAYAFVDGGDWVTTHWMAGSVHAAMMIGAITLLHHEACASWANSPGKDPPPAS